METRIRNNPDLLEKLFDAHTKYHTRRRLRPGCDCSYCIAKKSWTNKIGVVNFKEMYDMYYIPPPVRCYDWRDPDFNYDVKDAIRRWRRGKSFQAKVELAEIKKEII